MSKNTTWTSILGWEKSNHQIAAMIISSSLNISIFDILTRTKKFD